MKHSELRHQPRHVNPRIQVVYFGIKKMQKFPVFSQTFSAFFLFFIDFIQF